MVIKEFYDKCHNANVACLTLKNFMQSKLEMGFQESPSRG